MPCRWTGPTLRLASASPNTGTDNSPQWEVQLGVGTFLASLNRSGSSCNRPALNWICLWARVRGLFTVVRQQMGSDRWQVTPQRANNTHLDGLIPRGHMCSGWCLFLPQASNGIELDPGGGRNIIHLDRLQSNGNGFVGKAIHPLRLPSRGVQSPQAVVARTILNRFPGVDGSVTRHCNAC